MKQISYLLSFLLLNSCSSPPNSSIPESDIDLSYFLGYRAISQQIGLDLNPHQPTLRFWQEGSFDRIWMTQLTFDSTRTIKSEYTIFETRVDSTGKLLEYPILDSLEMKCNWIESQNEIDRLIKTGFDTIKSQNDYPGFQDKVADGWTFSIEVYRNGTYKFITYHCPAAYQDNSNQVFLKFLDVLDQYAFRQKKCGK